MVRLICRYRLKTPTGIMLLRCNDFFLFIYIDYADSFRMFQSLRVLYSDHFIDTRTYGHCRKKTYLTKYIFYLKYQFLGSPGNTSLDANWNRFTSLSNCLCKFRKKTTCNMIVYYFLWTERFLKGEGVSLKKK